MGCGISRFEIIKEGDASQLYTQLSLVHRPNDRAITHSRLVSKKTLPNKREEHAKGEGIHNKKVNPKEKGIKQREKEEAFVDKQGFEDDVCDRNDDISYTRSPSFRVYCIPSQSDDGNNEFDHNLEEIKDDQQVHVENDKKRSSIGRGKTNDKGQEKKIFKSHIFRNIFHSSC
ncbi:hypothetical protein ERO13_D10G081400v2 [Gossypium hirsutum]|uniref:Uncharacterized protein LOC107915973 n=2 Tax=Gossypium TaxID=3633 RepID=A0A1U8KDQ5_GOSHI|nr:uncharacterized protein LOC107915973 [Gossypium hirsutum]XP_016700636.1 uncharacterized protein LOC107915973 [Gossypium hirsutum]KAG4125153.1 hypothetical protein ERO13_D10G081400v2 [Gossypium hirsutum]TYG49407.1 hypothetical protein ES288_D10G092300v1 [Gossypium darwinii]